MEEKNELNDIILNKSTGVNGNKKIILVVATLGVILIIVVMLMNSLTSTGTDNLPQAVLPPEPKSIIAQNIKEEPLFEDVEVIQEVKRESEDLDKIAQRLKKESETKKVVPKKHVTPKKVAPKPTPKVTHKKARVTKKDTKTIIPSSTKAYYVQVGSFSKYEPDAKFIKSIVNKGFTYKYHKVTINSKILNKVLVGPFNTEKDARNALRTIRSSIESGAFLVKI